MKSIADLLRDSPFFEAFSPVDIEALAAHAVMRSVSAGDVILPENEPAEAALHDRDGQGISII